MKHSTQLVFLALAVLLLASSAFASIALVPSVKRVSLSRNDLLGLQFRLKNFGPGRTCIELDAVPNNSYIKASLSYNRVCLNEAETTHVTLSIKTRNAPKGSHIVTLLAESSNGNAFANVAVSVSGEAEIELVAYPNNVCRGSREEINVLVRNNSDEFKEVRLQAENEMLLPYFERNEVSLLPHQEKNVGLVLHPSPYSSLGRHFVSMYAITDDETVKKRIAIDVVECREEEIARFSVRIDSGCFVVEKEEGERIYFRVKNRLDEEQKVFFSVGPDLGARLNSSSAWLEEREERTFYFTVFAGEEATVKDYSIALHVWNSKHSVEKSVCVRPRKLHLASVEVEENDLVIGQCESAVFTILLKNLGDYYEEFELGLGSYYSRAEAGLSEDDVRLERRESKEVYVSVNVDEAAAEGSYSVTLFVEAAGEDFEEELRFRVVAKEEEEELPGGLEIVAFPTSLRMDENSEKRLLVSVKNNSEESLGGISISLLGLPQGITSSHESNLSLLPGQVKAFELVLKAGEGTAGDYKPVLQAATIGQSDERELRLIVETEATAAGTGLAGLVGLFAAGGSALLGLAALLIIVLAIVLVSKAFRDSSTQRKKEVWIRG